MYKLLFSRNHLVRLIFVVCLHVFVCLFVFVSMCHDILLRFSLFLQKCQGHFASKQSYPHADLKFATRAAISCRAASVVSENSKFWKVKIADTKRHRQVRIEFYWYMCMQFIILINNYASSNRWRELMWKVTSTVIYMLLHILS